MKPSQLLKANCSFKSNITYIQSVQIKETEQLLLGLIKENIVTQTKSYIFLSKENEVSKNFVLNLIASQMNTSVRNISNENYLKPRMDQYDLVLKNMDKCISIVNDIDQFFKDHPSYSKEIDGSSFFFINASKSISENNFVKHGEDFFAKLKMMFRFLNKASRIFKVKIVVGSDYSFTKSDLNSMVCDETGISSSFYKIEEDGLVDVGTSEKVFSLNKENNILSISKSFKGFKVDKVTGLFANLEYQDVLNLKELLREVSRNGKIDQENTYVKEWTECYQKIDTTAQLLEFQNKAYLSIVNKLQVVQ